MNEKNNAPAKARNPFIIVINNIQFSVDSILGIGFFGF